MRRLLPPCADHSWYYVTGGGRQLTPIICRFCGITMAEAIDLEDGRTQTSSGPSSLRGHRTEEPK